MDKKIFYPEEFNEYVDGLEYNFHQNKETKSCAFVFSDKYVIKGSKSYDELKKEYDTLNSINGKILCAKPIKIVEAYGNYYMLRTSISGKSLIEMNDPIKIVNVIADAYKMLRKLDKDSLEFVHGDFCLPNIITLDETICSGIIDFDNSHYGDSYEDIAMALWSLEYNLKTDKYNNLLLEKLNIEFDKKKYNKYIVPRLRKKLMEGKI